MKAWVIKRGKEYLDNDENYSLNINKAMLFETKRKASDNVCCDETIARVNVTIEEIK